MLYLRFSGALYRLASTAEQAVEELLLSVLPGSTFAGKTFAVGGYVRDEVMGLQSKDLDIVVEMPNGAEKLAHYLHLKFPTETSNPYQIGKGYPIWHLAFKTNVELGGKSYATEGAELDFADSQKESFPDPESRQRTTQYGSLEEDTIRRDFTVNMLMKDLTTGKVVDPTGMGVDDVKNGVLRIHPDVDPDKPFSDDPLRMLRLIRFVAKYGWKADPNTVEAVKRNAHRIEIVSAERIMEELVKIMKLGKLAQAVRFMSDTGLLKYVMPEIEALKGVEQPKKFHAEGDVFEHTMSVLEHAKPTVEAQLSALLHDAGKPATQKFLEGKIQFLGHEDVSAEIAEAFMRRLKMDNATISKVVILVKNHMRAHTSPEWGPKAIRKFVREMGEYLEDVLDLTAADALGRKMDEDVTRQGDDYIKSLRERIKKQQEIPISSKPVLNGREIMDALGIPPGAEVGKASRWLQEKSDELAEQGEAITKKRATELLKNEYKKTASTIRYRGAVYRKAGPGKLARLGSTTKYLTYSGFVYKLADSQSSMWARFERGRSGDPVAFITPPNADKPRPCFAERRGPKPSVGEIWEVEWAGENPKKTVGFLRLVKKLSLEDLFIKFGYIREVIERDGKTYAYVVVKSGDRRESKLYEITKDTISFLRQVEKGFSIDLEKLAQDNASVEEDKEVIEQTVNNISKFSPPKNPPPTNFEAAKERIKLDRTLTQQTMSLGFNYERPYVKIPEEVLKGAGVLTDDTRFYDNNFYLNIENKKIGLLQESRFEYTSPDERGTRESVSIYLAPSDRISDAAAEYIETAFLSKAKVLYNKRVHEYKLLDEKIYQLSQLAYAQAHAFNTWFSTLPLVDRIAEVYRLLGILDERHKFTAKNVFRWVVEYKTILLDPRVPSLVSV